MRTVFIRALEALDDKQRALLDAIQRPQSPTAGRRFDADPRTFASVPGSPFAYWISPKLRSLFNEVETVGKGRLVKLGTSTKNDVRHLRLWWELPYQSIGSVWKPLAKGGPFSPFYADLHLTIKWENNAAEIEAELLQKYSYLEGNVDFVLHRSDPYFRPGLSWPRRTKSPLSLRVLPRGAVFADKGPAIVSATDDVEELLTLLAVGTSKVFRFLVGVQLAAADASRSGAAHSFEVGVIQRTPFPEMEEADRATLAALARQSWARRASLDTVVETSHAFVVPALLQVNSGTLASRTEGWCQRRSAVYNELAEIQTKLDELCFKLYDVDQDDRRAIVNGFGIVGNHDQQVRDASDEEEDDEDTTSPEEVDSGERTAADEAALLTSELMSWSIGVGFGRFDIRIATGVGQVMHEPEPFDALGAYPRGALTGVNGSPLAAPPDEYPIRFPADGLLVDDPGHVRDVVTATRSVFDLVFLTSADARWSEAASLVRPNDYDVRRWIASEFFEDHLKRYSKSRRKAPIYWQLGTSSRQYALWLYAHRLTRDTFFHVQQEVLGPKVAHEERKLVSLTQDAGPAPTTGQRRDLANQEAFVEELRAMRDEVARVAPLWNPDLDDGVVITMAPLWRLVPQHRAWQRELQSTWTALAAGKYDWAHLAMHLWPERVVLKCAEDRSLAIAHGLEDVFWEEGADGKWCARPAPTRPVADLVRERTSPAVKDALRSLMEAPVAGAGAGRGRRLARGARARGGR